MNGTLTLVAEDAEDLEIISARLQDAVARVKDLAWLPNTHRFAALFNRFKWEDVQRKREGSRVRSGLIFENVLSAKSHNILYDNPQAVLSLLAIRFSPRGSEDPGGTIELVFSGGGALRLVVECIEASLADVSGEWAARGQPAHPEAI
ncbi:MAG TPA: DUF2948 family protein [Rhizomicrobium sp.]|jgi:hypothetical protein|nr:DUF2948 family protein [Rhizomicrobium sp.]